MESRNGNMKNESSIAHNKGLTQLPKSQDTINKADTKIFGNSESDIRQQAEMLISFLFFFVWSINLM